MTQLQWKDEYSVGIDDVDFEHQCLIELINSIYEQLENQPDAAEICGAMSNVHTQISAHFALEERIMRDSGFAEYEAHKNHHEELLDQVRTMMDSIDENPDSAIDMLNENLADWFGIHFATFDARLHQAFAQKE